MSVDDRFMEEVTYSPTSETEDFITDRYYDIVIADYMKNKVLEDLQDTYCIKRPAAEKKSHLVESLEDEIEFLRNDSQTKNRLIELLINTDAVNAQPPGRRDFRNNVPRNDFSNSFRNNAPRNDFNNDFRDNIHRSNLSNDFHNNIQRSNLSNDFRNNIPRNEYTSEQCNVRFKTANRSNIERHEQPRCNDSFREHKALQLRRNDSFNDQNALQVCRRVKVRSGTIYEPRRSSPTKLYDSANPPVVSDAIVTRNNLANQIKRAKSFGSVGDVMNRCSIFSSLIQNSHLVKLQYRASSMTNVSSVVNSNGVVSNDVSEFMSENIDLVVDLGGGDGGGGIREEEEEEEEEFNEDNEDNESEASSSDSSDGLNNELISIINLHSDSAFGADTNTSYRRNNKVKISSCANFRH